MERYIDLHTHSNYSDGTDNPEALVRKAKEAGLHAVALTDHDTVAGVDDFVRFGREFGIETIKGIEISTQMGDVEVHVLGYNIEPDSGAIKRFMIHEEESRREKNRKMLVRLREIGFDIWEEDFSESKGIVTRGSIAGVMFQKGFVSSKREAFDKFIGEGRPAFVDRERLAVRDAVELIKICGGAPVIAHPYLYKIDDNVFEAEIRRLADIGLRGVEVLYQEGHTVERELFYRALANKYSLSVTGGSDYHGDNKTVKLGFAFNDERIPYSLLDGLRLF